MQKIRGFVIYLENIQTSFHRSFSHMKTRQNKMIGTHDRKEEFSYSIFTPFLMADTTEVNSFFSLGRLKLGIHSLKSINSVRRYLQCEITNFK